MIDFSPGFKKANRIVFRERLSYNCCKWNSLSGIYSCTKQERNLPQITRLSMTEHEHEHEHARNVRNRMTGRALPQCCNLATSFAVLSFRHAVTFLSRTPKLGTKREFIYRLHVTQFCKTLATKNTVFVRRGAQVFQKSRSHLKLLVARKVT